MNKPTIPTDYELALEVIADLTERLNARERENEINAADALRALEFDLVVGPSIPGLVKYCEERIAAIKAGDTEATIKAREEHWSNAIADQRAVINQLVEALRPAVHELNVIRARDGVPYTHYHIKSDVNEEYFSKVVDDGFAALSARPEGGER